MLFGTSTFLMFWQSFHTIRWYFPPIQSSHSYSPLKWLLALKVMRARFASRLRVIPLTVRKCSSPPNPPPTNPSSASSTPPSNDSKPPIGHTSSTSGSGSEDSDAHRAASRGPVSWVTLYSPCPLNPSLPTHAVAEVYNMFLPCCRLLWVLWA